MHLGPGDQQSSGWLMYPSDNHSPRQQGPSVGSHGSLASGEEAVQPSPQQNPAWGSQDRAERQERVRDLRRAIVAVQQRNGVKSHADARICWSLLFADGCRAQNVQWR